MLRKIIYRHVVGVAFVSATFVGLVALSGQSILAEDLLTEDDPIAYIGHGVMFDRNGNRIEPTPQFIAKAQAVYSKFLSDQLPDQQRQQFKSKSEKLFAGAEFDEQSRLIANSSLIDWEIQNVDAARVEDLDRLAAKNNFLKWLLRSQLTPADQPLKERGEFKMPSLLQNRIDEAGLSEAVLKSTTLSGAAYIDECRNAGVPIPPDWGSNQWQSKGFLSTNFLGSASTPAEVFVAQSTSPPGVSIALPRYTSTAMTTINLLGIISLGQASSKVCFWDNQKNDVNFNISKGEAKPLREFAGGAELFEGSGGRCTACHAGENPFVIHPKTTLGLPNLGGLPLFANEWYQPLVHPNWPQNPGPLVGTTGACNACHTGGGEGGRFPQMSNIMLEYCGAVLGNAIKLTMPPGNPGDTNFAEHEKALETLCKSPPAPVPTEAGIAEIMESILLPLR
jgi:hypothetical protein